MLLQWHELYCFIKVCLGVALFTLKYTWYFFFQFRLLGQRTLCWTVLTSLRVRHLDSQMRYPRWSAILAGDVQSVKDE